MNTCLYFTLGNPFHIQFYTQSYVNIEIAVNTFTCTDVFTAVTTNQNTRISALANIWGGGGGGGGGGGNGWEWGYCTQGLGMKP